MEQNTTNPETFESNKQSALRLARQGSFTTDQLGLSLKNSLQKDGCWISDASMFIHAILNISLMPPSGSGLEASLENRATPVLIDKYKFGYGIKFSYWVFLVQIDDTLQMARLKATHYDQLVWQDGPGRTTVIWPTRRPDSIIASVNYPLLCVSERDKDTCYFTRHDEVMHSVSQAWYNATQQHYSVTRFTIFSSYAELKMNHHEALETGKRAALQAFMICANHPSRTWRALDQTLRQAHYNAHYRLWAVQFTSRKATGTYLPKRSVRIVREFAGPR